MCWARSQVETGLLMTPWPLTVAVIAPFAGRLADRYPAGILGGIGLAALALGLLLLALLPADPATPDVVWRMAICGFGFGFFNSPNNRAMITAAPRSAAAGRAGCWRPRGCSDRRRGAALVAMAFGFFGQRGTTVTLIMGACFAGVAALVSLVRLVERDRRSVGE